MDFWDDAHFGIIIFSKQPFINKQTVMWNPYDYNSIIQYADLVNGTDTFRLFNLHLQSLRFSRDNLKYIDQPTVEDGKALKEQKSIISKFKNRVFKKKNSGRQDQRRDRQKPLPCYYMW